MSLPLCSSLSNETPHLRTSIKSLDFLASVSHEIRNPVNVIYGLTQLLKDAVSSEEKEELIKGLLNTSESLLELVNNLMDFKKLESGELQFTYKKTDLKKARQESLSGFEAIARTKGLELEIEVDRNFPPLVIVDKVKVIQVVINLVSNAVKFTPSGSITVTMRVAEITKSGIVVEFSVKDTGIGIPADKLYDIFEAFEQVSGEINYQYGGTGLGLSICKNLVQTMQGEIFVKSKLGEGSKFSFLLPLKLPEVITCEKVVA